MSRGQEAAAAAANLCLCPSWAVDRAVEPTAHAYRPGTPPWWAVWLAVLGTAPRTAQLLGMPLPVVGGFRGGPENRPRTAQCTGCCRRLGGRSRQPPSGPPNPCMLIIVLYCPLIVFVLVHTLYMSIGRVWGHESNKGKV